MKYTDKIYAPGTLPPIGEVPRKFHAWTIRSDRLGSPETAFRDEIVDTPELKDDEVLAAVVAAGVNYNGVWASSGSCRT